MFFFISIILFCSFLYNIKASNLNMLIFCFVELLFIYLTYKYQVLTFIFLILLLNFLLLSNLKISNFHNFYYIKRILMVLLFIFLLSITFFTRYTKKYFYYLYLFISLGLLSILVNYILCFFPRNINKLVYIDTILILGCRLDKNGQVTEILKSRLLKGHSIFITTNKSAYFINSGGSPHSSASECIGMKKYLIKLGVHEKKIIIENESNNTLENIKNSIELIKTLSYNPHNIALVTSDFHLYRALIYSKLNKLDVIGVPSKGIYKIDKIFNEITCCFQILFSKFLLYLFFCIILLLTSAFNFI